MGPDPALSGGLFAQNQALDYAWRSGAEPPTAIRTAIRAAPTTSTRAARPRPRRSPTTRLGANPIGYGPGATCGVNGLACFTRNAPTGFTMWLREQGHVFDWGTLKWCQALATAPNGCYDAETIALDEFGHVEGLDHHANYADDRDYEDAVVQTYSRTKPAAGYNAHAFGTMRRATLQRRTTCRAGPRSTRPAPAWPRRHGQSPRRRGWAWRDRHGHRDPQGGRRRRLRPARNNPLAGRSVTLQRRVTGTTAWVGAGTMSAGPTAGTYVASARLVTGRSSAPSSRPRRTKASGATPRPCSGSSSADAPAPRARSRPLPIGPAR